MPARYDIGTLTDAQIHDALLEQAASGASTSISPEAATRLAALIDRAIAVDDDFKYGVAVDEISVQRGSALEFDDRTVAETWIKVSDWPEATLRRRRAARPPGPWEPVP